MEEIYESGSLQPIRKLRLLSGSKFSAPPLRAVISSQIAQLVDCKEGQGAVKGEVFLPTSRIVSFDSLVTTHLCIDNIMRKTDF